MMRPPRGAFKICFIAELLSAEQESCQIAKGFPGGGTAFHMKEPHEKNQRSQHERIVLNSLYPVEQENVYFRMLPI